MTDETNPNRWTAEVIPCDWGWGVKLWDGGEVARLVGFSADYRDGAESLAEQINRPAPTAPADDLPPGYIEWNGETWVMPGTAIVDGWGWWDTSNPCPGLRQVCGPRPTKVRRIIPAEPATEWVSLHEALRDKRKIRANGVAWVTCHQVRMLDGRVQVGTPGIGWALVGADGKVEVQR